MLDAVDVRGEGGGGAGRFKKKNLYIQYSIITNFSSIGIYIQNNRFIHVTKDPSANLIRYDKICI